jgi:hypothetical protein
MAQYGAKFKQGKQICIIKKYTISSKAKEKKNRIRFICFNKPQTAAAKNLVCNSATSFVWPKFSSAYYTFMSKT